MTQFNSIAGFALGAPEMPESALRMAGLLLVDTLAVAAGATNMAPGRIARDHAARFLGASDPRDQATLMFDGRKASIAGAAFAAATQIDNLDAHDGYNPTKGHIGCAVVPALIAFAEAHPELSGRDALRILTMSYELSARAAVALHSTVSDYHTSGAWNALGAAAIGCNLMQQTDAQFRHAMGIAEYHGPRSQMMREIANPTMLHDGSGMGALVGAMAALQAADGFEGAPAITLEAEECRHIWADLGQDWTIEKNYIKPYPICRWAHAAIDALDHLLKTHALVPHDITKISVRTFAQAAELYRGIPQTTSQAQYSLPFAMAARLVHGEIGPDHIQGAGLSNPEVANVVAMIEVIEDPKHSVRFPAGRWSDVTVTLTDGRELRSGDIHARGGPEAPMSDTELHDKFNTIAACLPKTRRDALWEMQTRLLQPDAKFSEIFPLIHNPI